MHLPGGPWDLSAASPPPEIIKRMISCRRTGDFRFIGRALSAPRNIHDLHELINACDQKGAIIFCTQYDPDDWYFRIDCDRGDDEDSAVTEAILDRIINNRYNVILESSVSMRKRHGFIAGSEGGRND